MEHLDGGILAAVLGVGQGGLAGAGQTEHGRDELVAVRQRVFLLTAVAAGVAIAVGDGPGQGQGALLVLAEVAHTQNGGAVGLRVEVAQALGVADLFLTGCAGPLGIGEDVDVRLLAVAYGLGVLVHLHIFRGHILEVQHPVVEEVFLTLRDQQMGLHHELGVQTDEHLGVIHGLPAGVVHGVHDDLIQGGGVHAGLAGDAAGGGVAAGDGAVIEQQDLGVRFQTEFLAPVDGHIGDHGAGRIFGQLIGFLQGVDLDDIVAVERSFDDGTGLGKTHLAGTDLGSGIIGLCGHIGIPPCNHG